MRSPQLASLWVFCAMLFGVGCMAYHPDRIADAPAGSTFHEVDGVALRYVDIGPKDAPPVVLLHGFAASLDTWNQVAPELATKHRVIALDLMGFGYSGRPERDYAPAAQARLVFGLLDALGVKSADVVAHSWGSSVALAMAVAEPGRVRRLALYDAWVYEEQLPTLFLWSRADGVGETLFGLFYRERVDDKIAQAFYDERNVTQELVDGVQKQMDRPGTTAAALAATRGQRFTSLERHIREVEQPVLLLWGREDRVSRLDIGERLHRELANSKLVVYPQCGHFPMIEAYSASTRELVTFLGEDAKPEPGGAPAPEPEEAPGGAPAPEPEEAPGAPEPNDASPSHEPTEAPDPGESPEPDFSLEKRR